MTEMRSVPPWHAPRVWLLPLLACCVLMLLWPDGRNARAFIFVNHLATWMPEGFWSALTVLGDTLTALCLALLFLRHRPEWTLAMLWAAIPATLISHGLKDLLDVARPAAVLGDSIHVVGPILKAGAFPSGHTTTAFVLAAVLTIGLQSTRAVVAVLALALMAGLSRIAVGAHWPADVAGGMLCGWSAGLIGIWLNRKYPMAARPTVMAGVRLFLIGCTLLLLTAYDSRYPLARSFEQLLAFLILVVHLLPGWHMTPRRH